jgi:hypothetical protein
MEMKMKIKLLLIVCCIIAIQIPAVYAKDPSPEQLVTEHLKSIGESDALSQAKSINALGTAEVNFVLGMQDYMDITGHARFTGTSMLVSQGSQIGISMKFPDNNYPGEYFAYDGKSVTVGNFKPGQKSPIAEFLHQYNKILKNGILGGVYSKSWPLLDIKRNRPNMKVRKIKIGGVEVYELEYRPRDNHGDMKIRMFFDIETYWHLSTEYVVQITNDSSRMASSSIFGDDGINDMAIGNIAGETYYTLTESFGDFKKIGALTLPQSYTLNYSISSPNRSGFSAQWKINVQETELDTPDIPKNLFKAE